MRLVVTGKRGQVVQSLLARAPLAGHQVITLGRPDFDLTEPRGWQSVISALEPDVIVSAAAYTAVDKAETDTELAHTVNAGGPGALAEVASALAVPLIHLSTDYVFAGDQIQPYRESDPVRPLSVYGASKLAGEQAVLARHGDNAAVLRTAWVYSPFGANFVRTMLRLAADRDEVAVVADQFGNPTSALDIADAIVQIATNMIKSSDPALRGVFHMTASGETSWAGFAEAVFSASGELGGPCATVRPIATRDYPTPAHRPANSRLDCTKLHDHHGVRLPDWRDPIDPIVAQLVRPEA